MKLTTQANAIVVLSAAFQAIRLLNLVRESKTRIVCIERMNVLDAYKDSTRQLSEQLRD